MKGSWKQSQSPRARMMRSPALLPAAAWPKATTIPDNSAPDWTWRLQVVRDTRPDPIKRQPEQPPLPVFDSNAPQQSVALIAARHAQVARSPNDPVRSIVFPSNVGVVRFETTDSGGVRAVHEISSPDDPETDTGSAYTHHEVDLGPPASDQHPVLQTL